MFIRETLIDSLVVRLGVIKKMERISRQTLVRNKKTGQKGVTVDDTPGMLSCCSDEETPVVYEGTTTFSGTLTRNLEVIGPENAIANLEKCGAGTENCCLFLTVGSKGPECERFSQLRFDLIMRKETMKARREPTELYPKCQLGN
ncbi:MAG: hypothetical protein ABH876_01175 [Patescibacteria group bacterium]